MTKSREFWLVLSRLKTCDCFSEKPFKYSTGILHVIEYKAYQELQESIKILESRVKELFHENIRLKTEVK